MGSKVEYVESSHMYATNYIRNSKAIGVLWGIFTICYAIIGVVAFITPEWLGDLEHENPGRFGLWMRCSFGGNGELSEECIGRLDDLSTIANVPFKASTILVAIAVIIAIVSICAMLLFFFCQGTTVFYLCGWMQVISGSENVLEYNEEIELVPLEVKNCETYQNTDSVKESMSSASQSSSNDIREILKQTPQGIGILSQYVPGTAFSNNARIQLANAIISVEISKSKDYKITSHRLKELAQSIEIEFPPEKKETYYIPYSKNKATNKICFPKGKLHNKYSAHRTFLIQSGVIIISKRNSGSSEQKPFILGQRENLRALDASTNCTEQLNWLKNNIEPWSTVERLWRSSSKTRIEEFLCSSEVTAHQYFNTYPALKQPLGFNLLNIDFCTIHAEKELSLFARWPQFAQEIVNYCKNIKANDKCVQDLLAYLEDPLTGSLCDNPIVILRLLPLLLPPSLLRVKNKPVWRPSRAEGQNGFFLHVTSSTELEAELNRRRQKLLQHGLTEQPLPVVVSEKLDSEIAYCYICVNNIKYMVSNPLTALDFAFKAFFALQLEYPREAEFPWLVIQHKLYEISGESNNMVPCVMTLLADLTNSK